MAAYGTNAAGAPAESKAAAQYPARSRQPIDASYFAAGYIGYFSFSGFYIENICNLTKGEFA